LEEGVLAKTPVSRKRIPGYLGPHFAYHLSRQVASAQ